jgi:YD repeat-containing protein
MPHTSLLEGTQRRLVTKPSLAWKARGSYHPRWGHKGRIRVIATDASGKSTPDDGDTDFTVLQSVGRAYIYDELNRLTQVIYEDGRVVTYAYDAAGNRITLTNE